MTIHDDEKEEQAKTSKHVKKSPRNKKAPAETNQQEPNKLTSPKDKFPVIIPPSNISPQEQTSSTLTCNTFSREIAMKYGERAAAFIHHFQFWIKLNKEKNQNLREGRTWTYQTIKSLQALFPYVSIDGVGYVLDKLVSMGVLLKNNFNKRSGDRTCWYAFVDENLFISETPCFERKQQKTPEKSISNNVSYGKSTNSHEKRQKTAKNDNDKKDNSSTRCAGVGKSTAALPDTSNPDIKHHHHQTSSSKKARYDNTLKQDDDDISIRNALRGVGRSNQESIDRSIVKLRNKEPGSVNAPLNYLSKMYDNDIILNTLSQDGIVRREVCKMRDPSWIIKNLSIIIPTGSNQRTIFLNGDNPFWKHLGLEKGCWERRHQIITSALENYLKVTGKPYKGDPTSLKL